jgi:hypothetical protein
VNKSVTLESGNTNITGVCTATSFSGSGANLTSLPSQVTINNASGNRVITSDGGTTLNCEDTLRYDGTNFLIGTNTEAPYSNRNLTVAAGGSGSSTVAIEIRSPSNGTGRVIFSDGTSADSSANEGQVIYQQSDHKMLFGVAANYQNMALESTGGTGANLNLIDGNLKFASGHGIDFSATADTGATGASTSSELLDDYEEGSFTPYIDREHGSPIIGYDAQDGYYTKIGRVVYFYAEVRINSYNGNGSYGNTFLRGLPYNSAARTGGRGVWNSVQYNSYYRDIDTTDGERDIAVVQGSSEKVVFYVMRSENSWTAPPAPDANDQFKIGGFYFT